MPWEIHSATTAFAQYREDWDALNHALFGDHPYFDSRFIEPLLKQFGTGREKLCIHRSAARADGMLLLTPCWPGRWCLFVPSQAQISPILISDPALLDELMQNLPGCAWLIELLYQDPLYTLNLGETFARRQTSLDHALTIAIDVVGDFDTYWNNRPKSLIANMRKWRKRLDRDGLTSRLNILTSPESMRDGLARFGELESKGWKGRNGSAVHIDNAQGAFYLAVFRGFAVSGQATIYEYYLGDRLASSQLAIHKSGMIVLLKTTYEEAFMQYAPGRLLLHSVISHAFAEQPGVQIEFYTNASVDELAWSGRQRWIQHTMIFRYPALYHYYGIIRNVVRWIRQRVPGRGVKPHKNTGLAY